MTKQTMTCWFGLLAHTSALIAACGGGDSNTNATRTTSSSQSIQPANFLAARLKDAVTGRHCEYKAAPVI